MEVCIVNIKNPLKLKKKKVVAERKLPFWVPKSDAHTKAKVITLTRRLNLLTKAKNQKEAETNIIDLISQMGLEIVRLEVNQ